MRIKEYTDMIYACGRCNYCRGMDFNERCPEILTQKWESSTARGRMAIARAILEGELEYTEELAERIYGCFTCARCKEECKKAANIDIMAITKAMRADFVDQGITIPDEGAKMADIAIETGNIFAAPQEVHTIWASDFEFREGSGTLFFPGCLASHRFKEKTQILVKLLQAAGYELDFLGEDQKCCGSPLWVIGKVEKAKQWAEDYLTLLKSRGVKEIITPCPSCFRAFDEEFPELLGLEEFPIEVRHTSVVLAEIVEKKKLKLKKLDKVVTYHDPCEIGRYKDIYEAPREVINAIPGIDFREMSRIREQAFCCGGGGGVKITYPDYSQEVSTERIQDVLDTGTTIVATICPACELNLTHAVYEEDVEVRVLDVAELLAVSAGVADEEILEPEYFPED
ncbi:MAG: (Fe-S)-binding protein [Candidatus Thorarchaeota archaeon]|jgi:Fe-S oxidoreductase